MHNIGTFGILELHFNADITYINLSHLLNAEL